MAAPPMKNTLFINNTRRKPWARCKFRFCLKLEEKNATKTNGMQEEKM
jgi:hypothetical protein